MSACVFIVCLYFFHLLKGDQSKPLRVHRWHPSVVTLNDVIRVLETGKHGPSLDSSKEDSHCEEGWCPCFHHLTHNDTNNRIEESLLELAHSITRNDKHVHPQGTGSGTWAQRAGNSHLFMIADGIRTTEHVTYYFGS